MSAPTVGFRFDIDRLGSTLYDEKAWKIFWRAISPESLAGSTLFDGDSSATQMGFERVFCIGVNLDSNGTASDVIEAITRDPEFLEVAAVPATLTPDQVVREPLTSAGSVDPGGALLDGRAAAAALAEVRPTSRIVRPEPLNASRVCSNCGTPAAREDQFCTSCGRALPKEEAAGSTVTMTIPAALPSQVIVPQPAGGWQSRRWLILIGAIALGLILIAAVAFAVVSNPAEEGEEASQVTGLSDSGRPARAVDPIGEAPDTPVSNEPLPPQQQTPISTREIKTQYGLVRIEGIRLTNNYTECPISSGGQCKNVSGGSKYIMFLTLKSAEGKSGETFQNDLSTEAFGSYVVTSSGTRAKVNSTSPHFSTGIDVIYEFFDSSSTAGLVLYWPENTPIKLEGIGATGASGGGGSGTSSGSTGSRSGGTTQPQPPPNNEAAPEEEPPPAEEPPDEEPPPEDYFPPDEE